MTSASMAQKSGSKTKKEAIRYCLVTPLVGLTDFATYFLAMKIFPVSFAKGLAFAVAAVLGYILNKYFTFAKKGLSAVEAAKYGGVQVGVLFFNVAVNKAALIAFPEAFVPAMIAASLLSAVLSFVSKKWLVFG